MDQEKSYLRLQARVDRHFLKRKRETMSELSPDFCDTRHQPGGPNCFYPIAILLHRALEEYLAGRGWENDGAISPPCSHRIDGRAPRKNVAEIVHDLLRAKEQDGLSVRLHPNDPEPSHSIRRRF